MKKYLNDNDTTNCIRLELRHPAGKNRIWVLVEGDTDQKLFAKLIDGQHVKVEQVHGGVENLRKAIETLVDETNRVVGIRDSDFLQLSGKRETIKYLFVTDCHDAEMMIVQCDHSFSSVVAEFSGKRFKDFQLLRNEIIQSLTFLSGIRWKNETANLELNFKGLGVGCFYDGESKVLQIEACLENIHKRSPNKRREVGQEEIIQLLTGVTDYPSLCNGHDFVKAFALHASANSEKGIGHNDVEVALRVAYRREDFENTMLFKNLENWQHETGHNLFA